MQIVREADVHGIEEADTEVVKKLTGMSGNRQVKTSRDIVLDYRGTSRIGKPSMS
jgi:hypothetical protein